MSGLVTVNKGATLSLIWVFVGWEVLRSQPFPGTQKGAGF